MATVAKSRGLDDRFVETTLLPRCLDWDSIVGSWAETGEYVIGRSFARQRHGIAHQIVVPATQSNSAVQDMWRMLSATDFSAERNGGAPGGAPAAAPAPEIAMLHYDREGIRLDNCDDALLRLGVNEALFKAMLRAALEAVPAGRCVYIVPNVKPSLFMDASISLLKCLVAALPFAHRRRLGFLACAAMPDAAEAPGAARAIRAVAAEAGANLIVLTPAVAEHCQDLGEYVFNYANGTFWEPQDGQSLYAECAWADRKRDRSPIYAFFSRTMPGSAAFDADELGVFSVFARILDAAGAQSPARGVSAMALYARNRLHVLEEAARLLGGREGGSPAGASSAALTIMLRDVFARILDFEERDRRARPDIGGAAFGMVGTGSGAGAGSGAGSGAGAGTGAGSSAVSGAVSGAENDVEAGAAAVLAQIASVAELLHDAAMDARAARLCVDAATYTGGDRFVDGLLTRVMESRRVFRLMLPALSDESSVLPWFVASRLEKSTDVQWIIDDLEMWAEYAPALFMDKQVVLAFCGSVERVLSSSADRIADGAEIHSRMEYTLRNISSDVGGRAVFGCVKELLECADRSVLEALTGDRLTVESLSRLCLDSDGLRDDSRYKAAVALKAFFCDPNPHAASQAAIELRSLGAREWQRLRAPMLRMLAPRVGYENYVRIAEAFTDPPLGGAVAANLPAAARDGGGAVRFDEMFAFVCEAKNRGECCNFIKWAFRNGAFVGHGYADFNNAVVKFFSGFTPKEFNIVQRNYAYLYAGQELSDSEQNLKHILDVFRERYNALAAGGKSLRLPARQGHGISRAKAVAAVAAITVVICAAVGVAFALLTSFFK